MTGNTTLLLVTALVAFLIGMSKGGLGGAAGALARAVSIYLLMQNVTPAVFIATSALFFLILNWIKVPFYIYADLFDFEQLRQIAWLVLLVPLGVWTGRWLAFKVNRETFENIIVGLLLINGLMLIIL